MSRELVECSLRQAGSPVKPQCPHRLTCVQPLPPLSFWPPEKLVPEEHDILGANGGIRRLLLSGPAMLFYFDFLFVSWFRANSEGQKAGRLLGGQIPARFWDTCLPKNPSRFPGRI